MLPGTNSKKAQSGVSDETTRTSGKENTSGQLHVCVAISVLTEARPTEAVFWLRCVVNAPKENSIFINLVSCLQKCLKLVELQNAAPNHYPQLGRGPDSRDWFGNCCVRGDISVKDNHTTLCRFRDWAAAIAGVLFLKVWPLLMANFLFAQQCVLSPHPLPFTTHEGHLQVWYLTQLRLVQTVETEPCGSVWFIKIQFYQN